MPLAGLPIPMDFKDGTYEIIGRAMRVHQALGPGLREKPYENAMCIALRDSKITSPQQRAFPIMYERQVVGECVPDLVVGDTLVELKSVESIGSNEIAQVLNYLRIAGKKVGLVINFKNERLEWKRAVL